MWRQGIMTMLRDRRTSREDFIFFVDRLATYLIERAMEHLPHKPKTVVTPEAVEYQGQELDAHVSVSSNPTRETKVYLALKLVGVSILRS